MPSLVEARNQGKQPGLTSSTKQFLSVEIVASSDSRDSSIALSLYLMPLEQSQDLSFPAPTDHDPGPQARVWPAIGEKSKEWKPFSRIGIRQKRL